jgi:hypothetical protein
VAAIPTGPHISLTTPNWDRYDPAGPMRHSQARQLLPRRFRAFAGSLAAGLNCRQDSEDALFQFSPKLMFPDSDHLPTVGAIVTRNGDIPSVVPVQFSEPEPPSRLWDAAVPLAAVPKAGVDENHDPGSAYNEIRGSSQVAGMRPVANAGRPQRSPEYNFDSGIASPDARHDPTAS